MQVEVVISNIVSQNDIEAVVNSANANLRFGSGVAGAIHTAAGKELEAYCQSFAPLALGRAIVTPAFNLPNKYVIHTRAANYLLDDNPEAVLAQCLDSVFEVAANNNIQSVAIPAIGTGVFKFPLELCASITAKSVKANDDTSVRLLRVCVTDEVRRDVFQRAFVEQGIAIGLRLA